MLVLSVVFPVLCIGQCAENAPSTRDLLLSDSSVALPPRFPRLSRIESGKPSLSLDTPNEEGIYSEMRLSGRQG